VIDSAQPRSDGHVQRASSGCVLSLMGNLHACYWIGANYGPIFSPFVDSRIPEEEEEGPKFTRLCQQTRERS